MTRAETAIEPGYYSEALESGSAERLVLRFPEGNLLILPAEGDTLSIELELRGPSERLRDWKPSLRRREGIIVVADEGMAGVLVAEARILVPAAFRDVEIHSASGTIEVRELRADLLASTDSGSINVSGGLLVELSSVSGEIEVEGTGNVIARVGSSPVRCRDIEGSVSLESESGDLLIENASMNVVALTHSGDITVQRPGGRLRIVTTSGDVELDISGRFLGGEISTGAGDVNLILAGAHLELRAETLSGQLDAPGVEIPATTGPRRCAIRVGEGGRRLHVRSVSGDVEIEQ